MPSLIMKFSVYIAHIKDDSTQSVRSHLTGVSNLAGIYASKFGMSNCGQLAGLLHDIGKLTDDFQQYIRTNKPRTSQKKGPDHSTAGAVWVTNLLTPTSSKIEQLTAQLIALVIMSHHGGLVDIFDENGQSPYLKRLDKLNADSIWKDQYNQVIERLSSILPLNNLQELFRCSVLEVDTICKKMKESNISNQQTAGIMCKLLFSALIDADRYDTAAFMDKLSIPQVQNNHGIWSELCPRLEEKLEQLPNQPEINLLRRKISQHCLESASQSSGIFTLNCPTGSGKTFAGLRFALHHAAKHSKQRIIFIVPYLTILEQNVLEIRNILRSELSDDCLDEQILELHSAKEIAGNLSGSELESDELTTQRLEYPMIFTSMVRFLNTLFASGTRNIRGLHQFCNSILIFDEIQTLSLQHIGIFNQAINFLTTICNTTVVLSTATQPCLDRDFKNTISSLKMAPQPELSGCDLALREAFRRTELVDNTSIAGDTKSIAQFVWELVETQSDVLVILNTKTAVTKLYEAMLSCQNPENKTPIYILSTDLYPAHRKAKIQEIREQLGINPLVVISTQLIEAGVDISFHTVVRSLAGLDSLIQAAGRCNRHGIYHRSQVHIIKPEFETLQHLAEIEAGRNVMAEILRTYHKTPQKLIGGLDGEVAITHYFEWLYQHKENQLTYPIRADSGQILELYHLLGNNQTLHSQAKTNLGTNYRQLALKQSFKTASKYFRAIDQFGTSVVVAHGEAISLLDELASSHTLYEKSKILQKLQQYTVNLSRFDQAEIGNGIYFHEEFGIYSLDKSFYSEIFGVSRSQLELPFYGY